MVVPVAGAIAIAVAVAIAAAVVLVAIVTFGNVGVDSRIQKTCQKATTVQEEDEMIKPKTKTKTFLFVFGWAPA